MYGGDCRQRFRAVLVEATMKLDEQVKRIGRAVDDSKPYWEARKIARQAQVEAQKATQEFQRAVEILRAAKETIALAEERLLEVDSRQFDSAWQEMLNHATQRVMEAEQARTHSETEHRKTAANYNSCISHMKQLEKKLKRSINKSRPYFELKAKYYLQLEQLKRHVDERQAKLVVAKAEYRTALRNLESISEEIHAQRRSLAMGTREQGVGAEGDGGNDDIANFKMESDGLSMVSVSIDEENNHSSSSEEEPDIHSPPSPQAMPSSPSSSSSHPSTSACTPLDMPSHYPSSSLYSPCSYHCSSPSSSLLYSSCPSGMELVSPCTSHDPDSVCGSGHASPLLGPRSQCSGASSPDCDQERGDRAEGAEAALEAATEGKRVNNFPHFGKRYHVKGVISLPYAEIQEPFEAWLNLSANSSRIDYYHGQVSTYQLGGDYQWGVAYKVTPETTEVEENVMKCFQVNGTNNETVTPQAAIPDLKGFQFLRMEYYAGSLCEVWQNVTIVGYKKNTYTLWLTSSKKNEDGEVQPPTPIHYEMMGYNTLLGSHYDRYLVDYTEFSTQVDPNVFSLPEGMVCGGFPGPGVEHHMLANPMKDLIHTSASGHSQSMFTHFKEKFQRQYSDEKEHEEREHAFVHNLRYVHSKNRAGLPFSLALNSLSDRTLSELSSMRGRKRGKTPNRGLPFPSKMYKGVNVPDSLDWRLYGAVTPVKDQAICGSCWSFATTGAVEGALFLKTGSLQVLSQQVLVDCSWGFGNNGCDGGEEWRAYEWIMKHGGIATMESYGAYMGMNGFCHVNSSQLTANIQSYTNVTSGDAEALKLALFKHGPVAVSIDASHRSFVFYSHGVYYEPACGNTIDDLDHAVLAVGYGTLDGEPYWLIKNSWSTYWGNDGYILMSMKNNNCGVTTDATYVTLL
ncbi:SH3 domain-binding protein 5 [Channa argus]|uniref:SH3 domain-binding protein 5 n=1 Tax=Channa argus TaxID=215402 RepID=A0A6G1QYS2_CHAAH|nr:SH3 domain-binding protein 5 [Channa argus]